MRNGDNGDMNSNTLHRESRLVNPLLFNRYTNEGVQFVIMLMNIVSFEGIQLIQFSQNSLDMSLEKIISSLLLPYSSS